MAFIANASNQPAGQVISNDGFFPDLDLSQMRQRLRIDGTVTDERLEQAAIAAILHVNDQLAGLRQRSNQDGHARLDQLPASRIHGSSALVHLYLRAVYCIAKADLIERYLDYDTTASSFDDRRMAVFLTQSPDNERRNAAWAISDILGQPHSTVELI